MAETVQPLELDPDLASVMVKCPMPGQEHQPVQPFGEFAKTEKGREVAAVVMTNLAAHEANGMDRDKAISLAFLGGVVTDEEGNLVRAPQPEAVSPEPVAAAAESKKK